MNLPPNGVRRHQRRNSGSSRTQEVIEPQRIPLQIRIRIYLTSYLRPCPLGGTRPKEIF